MFSPKDRRQWPATRDIAFAGLAERFPEETQGRSLVEGEIKRIATPRAELRATPAGALDREFVLGTEFLQLATEGDWAFGFELASGYSGWLLSGDLEPNAPVTHWLATPLSHGYPAPDFKRTGGQMRPYFLGARLQITGEEGAFLQAANGDYLPKPHLRPIGDWLPDPVETARLFLGTPYYWGGNTARGVDCSGLVHAARSASGLTTARDADQQERMAGETVAAGEEAAGDLLFWKGHVAMATGNGMMIHANATHMRVVEEPIAEAVERIERRGDGPLRHRLRPA